MCNKTSQCPINVRSLNDIILGINGISTISIKAAQLPDFNPDFYIENDTLFVSLPNFSNGVILLVEDASTQAQYLVGGRPPRRPQTPTFPDVPKPL